MKGPWIHFSCPRCSGDSVLALAEGSLRPAPAGAVSAPGPGHTALACPRCGFTYPGPAASPDLSGPLSRCVVCGSEEFYVQKDFNRQVGLWIVGGAAGLAFLVMVIWGHLWGLLVLAGVTLADLLIYQLLPQVSVCYLCQTVYHGLPENPRHQGFYLGNEERWKALRQAWLKGLEP
jgi:hypothetical protein